MMWKKLKASWAVDSWERTGLYVRDVDTGLPFASPEKMFGRLRENGYEQDDEGRWVKKTKTRAGYTALCDTPVEDEAIATLDAALKSYDAQSTSKKSPSKRELLSLRLQLATKDKELKIERVTKRSLAAVCPVFVVQCPLPHWAHERPVGAHGHAWGP